MTLCMTYSEDVTRRTYPSLKNIKIKEDRREIGYGVGEWSHYHYPRQCLIVRLACAEVGVR